MAGSPRVERAARIRLDNPNLSTEEAMKLAGYDVGEAKDQKRQSNVRQKTHRLARGRKRPAESSELEFPEPNKRMSFPSVMHDNMFHPTRGLLPRQIPDQNMMHDYPRMPDNMPFSPQNARFPMDNKNFQYQSRQQQGFFVENPHAAHQYQHQHQHQHQHQPQPQPQPHHQQHFQQIPYTDTPAKNLNEKIELATKSPGGSPRIERAATIRLEDPTISTEEAMILAGFSPDEARDKRKQNNVRQKTHRLSTKRTSKSTGSKATQELIQSMKEETAKLEVKMDSVLQKIEDHLDRKMDEIGARIDQKIDNIMRLIEIRTSAHMEPNPGPKDPDSGSSSNISLLDTIQL